MAAAAGRLAALGVGNGDLVAIALPNRIELVIALFAAWRLGAAVTPVNPALTPAEMQYQPTTLGPRWSLARGFSSTVSRRSTRIRSAPSPTRWRC